MMFRVTTIFLLVTSLVTAQQCSYVTVPVCGDDVMVSPGRLGGERGLKGDAGSPGKMGPRGLPGPKGDNGIMGQKGEVGDLDDFKQEVTNKLRNIETMLTPPCCLTSSVFGYQRLRDCKEAFCDNGWTVIQRRFNGSVDFNRGWQDYKDGFGNMTGEFWLGLKKMHKITSSQGCRLRIDLRGFDGTFAVEQYSVFMIEDESDNYRLHIGGYSGTGGDSLDYHNGYPFTTKDRDNDGSDSNCALSSEGTPYGGWWFKSCFNAALNAPWGESEGAWRNLVWYTWKGKDEAVKESTMKIRCD